MNVRDGCRPILRVAVAAPLRQCFDYLPLPGYPLDQLKPGIRLRVPFGKTARIGVLLKVMATSSLLPDQLRPILEVLDPEPVLSPEHLSLLEWASCYYHHPIGGIISTSLPLLLRRGQWLRQEKKACAFEQTPLNSLPPPMLNPAQSNAVEAILSSLNRFQTFLLDGVTGSGKTEVYLQSIEAAVRAGKQALVLIPEIGLTPQTLARFRARFDVALAVFHSALTERERLETWWMAREGKAAIIIGTRSAVWTPLQNPGIFIVDEEHDLSYKQQEGFRYSARDVAIIRAQRARIPVVLGSATPSLESLHNARGRRYHYLFLPDRAGTAQSPHLEILDLRGRPMQGGISEPLIERISAHLERQEQVLLFLNRRGYAPLLLCHQCGWIAGCDRCDAKLTYHQATKALCCHHCGVEHPFETHCSHCGSRELLKIGYGTERIVETLKHLFPAARIVRIDRDSTRRKGALQGMLDSIQAGEAEILVGTQMLAKGHHFPKVTLVAIVDADSRLYGIDFRSSERLAQQVIQVAGRAGRAEAPGTVIIQTHHPHHPLLAALTAQGYAACADSVLKERRQTHLPPFSSLALLRAEAPSDTDPPCFLAEAKQAALAVSSQGITLFGPVPAPMERRAGRYRAQLLVQSRTRRALQQMLSTWVPLLENLKTVRRVRWSLDVDPQEMT